MHPMIKLNNRKRPAMGSANQNSEGSMANRLNWLRAGVLGSNDGIISTAGLVVGVAAATTNLGEIATAGVAGLIAGAVSMALGEYVSVSTQRDSEHSLISIKRRALTEDPGEQKLGLIKILQQRGLNERTSTAVAVELNESDELRALLSLEYGIDQEEVANPWVAAGSSAVAFSAGALLPLIAILLPPETWRIPVTFVAVLIGLMLTGALSAYLGKSSMRTAIVRLVVGGALAMAATFGIGQLLGTTVS